MDTCAKTSVASRPLTVREVLEQEFVQLHGELPESYRAQSGELASNYDPSCSCWVDRDAKLLGQLYARIHRLGKEGKEGDKQAADQQKHINDPDTEAERLLDQPRSGLCLSGGGIRSATFGLGMLQALASRGLLQQFDFLSTVSGGGYVGSWLSAWIHRDPEGIVGVCRGLKRGLAAPLPPEAMDSTTPAVDADSPTPTAADSGKCRRTDDDEDSTASGTVESPAVNHLRQYSNYLTPRLGAFSGDAWTVAATYFRNLLLNWLVLIPFIVGLLLLPHLFQTMLAVQPPNWVILANLVLAYLWFMGLVAAVAWLPSINRRTPGRQKTTGDESSNASPPTSASRRTVLALIIAPVSISCVCSSFQMVWLRLPGSGYPIWEALQLYVELYLAAAAAIQIVSWWRKSPNPPRPLRLYPTFAALALLAFALVLSIKASPLFRNPLPWSNAYICFAAPILLGIFSLLTTLYVGLTSWDRHPYADEDREWWARLSGVFLLCAVAWMVICGISLFGLDVVGKVFLVNFSVGSIPQFHDNIASGKTTLSSLITAATALVGLLGGRSTASGPHKVTVSDSIRSRIFAHLPAICAQISLVILLILISAAVSLLIDKVKHLPFAASSFEFMSPLGSSVPDTLHNAFSGQVLRVFLLTAGMFLAVLLFGRLINVNRLSLHAMYRNRLMRAYLGASNPARSPNPFTGFDPSDNIPMHHLRRRSRFDRGDLTTQKEGAPQDFSRVVKLARLWLGRNTNFSQYMWETMSREDQNALVAEDARVKEARKRRENASAETPGIPPGPEPDLDGAKLLDTVLRHLNRLVCDPNLCLRSVYAEPKERDPEIDAAYQILEADGACHLLNRLILERECVWDEQLPAADKNGKLEKKTDKLLGGARPPKPFHIINAALNLVQGRNLAWQQRKAASFTISPLHCGFNRGYRSSVEYGSGISLGTAVTISGAAASPNMGYHSSPAVTFLMTLFNVRLGWWLGNPSQVTSQTPWRKISTWIAAFPLRSGPRKDQSTYRLPSPRHPLRPVFDEAFGRTNESNDYVYLSDGGHFENLGLYELVRRRCRYILVSDASCDPSGNLDDLANAIRKIRIDLGVTIDLINVFFPLNERFKRPACAIGQIHYCRADGLGVEDGILIYLKPAMESPDPVDVYNYAAASDTFPHETTADQWFTESQFESYRKLGEKLAVELIDPAIKTLGHRPKTLGELFKHIRKERKGTQAKPTGADAPNPQAAPPSPDPTYFHPNNAEVPPVQPLQPAGVRVRHSKGSAGAAHSNRINVAEKRMSGKKKRKAAKKHK